MKWNNLHSGLVMPSSGWWSPIAYNLCVAFKPNQMFMLVVSAVFERIVRGLTEDIGKGKTQIISKLFQNVGN